MRWCMMAILMLAASSLHAAPVQPNSDPVRSFYERVDLSPLDEVTVWQDGRLKSFESFSRDTMNWISGPRKAGGLEPRVAMLDIMLRPQIWLDQDLYYVKNKLVRVEIARALRDSSMRPVAADDARLERFLDRGLAPRGFLTHPDVQAMLSRMRTDVMRFAKPVQAIDTALMVARPEIIRDELLLVPPVGEGALKQPWKRIDAVATEDPESPVSLAWNELQSQWLAGNAEGVTTAAAALAITLRGINPDLYPSAERLRTESMYFQWRGFTWGWIFYVLAVAILLMWVG